VKFKLKRRISDNHVALGGCLLAVALVSYLTGGNLVSPTMHSGPHQTINAWKIYQIEKNKLYPFYYDVELEDLSGGQFVSYWDTPLPYFFALVFSKILTPLGDIRFLAAIKVVTLLNFVLSYLAFYFLMRLLRVSRVVAAAIPIAFLAHRFNIFHLFSVNAPGVWALILPLLLFLRILQGERRARDFAFLGFSLALSALQNPYYVFFAAVLLSVPVLFDLSFHLWRRNSSVIPKYILTLICVVVPILCIEGSDLYKIYKDRIPDPQGRNYITKQSYAYRPWFHFLPPEGHLLSDLINPHFLKLNEFLTENDYLDRITLWFPEANNLAYIGIFNLLVLFGLLASLVRRKDDRLSSPLAWPFLVSLVLGAALCFRGDIFVGGSRHIVFPWYRLQTKLPLTTLHYYALPTIFYLYVLVGFLFDSIRFRGSGLKHVLLACFIIISILDVTVVLKPTEHHRLGSDLESYLREEGDVNRLFVEIGFVGDSEIDPSSISDPGSRGEISRKQALQRDGRYYQIFHKTRIYAPWGLTWFDLYSYAPPLLEVRNFETILTDKNQEQLEELGIDEMILIVNGIDGGEYWNVYLEPLYESNKSVRVFHDALVFQVRD